MAAVPIIARIDLMRFTGTFSSVYKAIDCQHPFYDNTKWCSSSSSSSSTIVSRSSASNLPRTLRHPSVASSTSSKRAHSRSSSASSKDSPYATLLNARKQLKTRAIEASSQKQDGGNPVYVAIKRIYVTSSPQRIHNELQILSELR